MELTILRDFFLCLFVEAASSLPLYLPFRMDEEGKKKINDGGKKLMDQGEKKNNRKEGKEYELVF